MRFTPPDAFSYIKGSLIGALPPPQSFDPSCRRFQLNMISIQRYEKQNPQKWPGFTQLKAVAPHLAFGSSF